MSNIHSLTKGIDRKCYSTKGLVGGHGPMRCYGVCRMSEPYRLEQADMHACWCPRDTEPKREPESGASVQHHLDRIAFHKGLPTLSFFKKERESFFPHSGIKLEKSVHTEIIAKPLLFRGLRACHAVTTPSYKRGMLKAYTLLVGV